MTTLRLQTLRRLLHTMQAMDQQQDQEEEKTQMLDTNIKQFIEAARQHFFAQVPTPAEKPDTPARTIH